MAFTRKHKDEMLTQYEEWLRNSEAVFMLEYSHMTVKQVETLRALVRQAGGQSHVMKNTLMKIALQKAGIQYSLDLKKTTLAGFATGDLPALAKVFSDATKSDTFTLKGGILNGKTLTAQEVKMLADLPPLPVMRAKLLGMLQAPAGKLVRTLAEPARQIAAVVKSYSEKAATPAG